MRGDFWCKNDFLVPQKTMGYKGLWVNRGMGYERFDCSSNEFLERGQ